MKKYIFLLAAWAIAGTLAFATANDRGEDITVKIEKGEKTKTVVLRLTNLEKLTTEIGIQNTEGRVIFKDYIRREAVFAAQFDLNTVDDGDYVLYVSNDAGIWTQSFSVNENNIAFFKTFPAKPKKESFASLVSYTSSEKSLLIARFAKDNPHTLGVLLSNLRQQPTIISLVYMGCGRSFSQEIKGEHGVSTALNLKGLQNGGYFAYVHAVDATVVQFFTLTDEGLVLGDYHRLDRPITVTREAVTSY